MTARQRLLLTIGLILFLGQRVPAQEVFVAPAGDDASPGTREAPVATLLRARDLLRSRRAGSKGAIGGAKILLAPGRYELRETLTLDERDSGCTWAPSVAGGPVVVSGGRQLRWAELGTVSDSELRRQLGATADQIRVVDLRALGLEDALARPWPDAFRGYGGWPELFAGGQVLQLARWPNEGYARIARVLERGSRPRHEEKPDRPGRFVFREDEPSRWKLDQEIYLNGYWCFGWYDEVLRVARLEPESKTVHLAAPHHYGVGGPSGGLFYSLNVRETLDLPGEYVLDRKAGRILLLPPEDALTGELTISLLRGPLVRASEVSGLRFQGLTFEATRGDGLVLEECTECVIASDVRRVAGWGIRIRGGRGCAVEGAEISATGLGGVELRGGDRATLTPGGHRVRDCEIHHYARLVRTYQPGVSLGGVGQVVEFCDLHDAPHQAIGFHGNDHRIRHNRIERVCLDTGDAGAIYCGRDWTLGGTVIERNWFAGLGRGAHHHNWAVYPDDQASGLTVRHNVVVDCPSGLLFGGGRSNVIEGNLFVGVGEWPIRFDARGMGWGKVSEPTLLARLAAVPSESGAWRERFPWLVGLAKDPKRNWPQGNRITGNRFLGSHAPSYDRAVREGGTVGDNLRLESDRAWRPLIHDGRVHLPAKGPELPSVLQGMPVGRRAR